MQLCKIQWKTGEVRVGVVDNDHVRLLDLERSIGIHTLSDVLHAPNPAALIADLTDEEMAAVPLEDVTLLAPVDEQEVWAAGVTYLRSKAARETESEGAALFYDLVYTAKRPELFFKATPHRVVGPGERVRIRKDSKWSVPEPEVGLVLSPKLKLIGYTVGNDMSARDIEGENPLYLPQAKVYDQCCAIGPVITLAEEFPAREKVSIRLTIDRRGKCVFEGSTSLANMARTFEDLIDWLSRENSFPTGVILLTGTGIVPPDDFTLQPEDVIHIDVAGIGTLSNVVC